MNNETEVRTQKHDRPSDSIGLGRRRETDMDSQEKKLFTSELTLSGSIRQLIQIRQVEESHALLASWTQLKSPGNSGMSGSRGHNTYASFSDTWHDVVTGGQQTPHRRNQLRKTTTLDFLTTFDYNQPGDDSDEPHMTQLMNANTNVFNMTQKNPETKMSDRVSDLQNTETTLERNWTPPTEQHTTFQT